MQMYKTLIDPSRFLRQRTCQRVAVAEGGWLEGGKVERGGGEVRKKSHGSKSPTQPFLLSIAQFQTTAVVPTPHIFILLFK
jgi:hypothetical protein